MPKKPENIEPIDADFDSVVKAVVTAKKPTQTAPIKPNEIKELDVNYPVQTAPLKQIPLDLGIEVEKDINGIEMGVLENGIPYLTQRGLSVVSGVARSLIYDITKEWEAHYNDAVIGKDRISFFKDYLFKNGFQEPSLHIETVQNGSIHYAYPDIVCMAFLEYYAFESKGGNTKALESYRQFATHGLQRFIYDSLDYSVSDKWKHYHDRVSLLKDSAPPGYFIIFQEVTGLVVDLITNDLPVNSKTIVDGSVGIHWGKYWADNNLEAKYGSRVVYPHYYPADYAQAKSNPQPANAYPDAALAEFRRWFRQVYLLTKFPAYILTKANLLLGGKAEALQIGGMYQNKTLPPPSAKSIK